MRGADLAKTKSRIGFIGCGAMARALAGGLIEAGVAPDRIRASDPMAAARSEDMAIATGEVTISASVSMTFDLIP